jgi:Cofactor assembly of complex C subunit B
MIDSLVLPSTLFLTLLITIGLFFFIRASTKDRIETATWTLSQLDKQVLQDVTQYLEGRGYRLETVDREQNQVVFTGFVKASVGLAVFLSILAAVGLLCFGLVLTVQFPQLGYGGLWSVVVAPVAGWFYYQKSQRTELVKISMRAENSGQSTRLRVTAHRDEIAALQANLNYPEPQES